MSAQVIGGQETGFLLRPRLCHFAWYLLHLFYRGNVKREKGQGPREQTERK
jgi:hypothetical protein